MNRKKGADPTKRTMNLFYKPDRTTMPATAALYVLFALTCLLGLGKVTVYDLWAETRGAEQTAAGEQTRLEGIMAELADYSEVQERYSLYSATEEERAAIDRMEVLELLDGALGGSAELNTVAIGGDAVQLQFSGVTLAETARIVRALEASPIVAGTRVNTASTTEGSGALVQASVFIQLQKEEGP